MASENVFLRDISPRLGINDVNALRKAEEFLRVLNNKCKIRNINDVAKTVLCLDLASTFVGISFDKKKAATLSGLSKSQYQNNLHVVEKLLNICKPLSISDLCVILSCTSIKEIAEDIWSKYRNNNNEIKDLTHPQYIAASIYTACQLKKVKVDKQQFIQASHLKPSQWKKLIQEFDQFIEKNGLENTKTTSSQPSVIVNTDNFQKTTLVEKDSSEEKIEEYEVWKNRILKEAREALKLNDV